MNKIKEIAKLLGKRGGDKTKTTHLASYYSEIAKKRWAMYRTTRPSPTLNSGASKMPRKARTSERE